MVDLLAVVVVVWFLLLFLHNRQPCLFSFSFYCYTHYEIICCCYFIYFLLLLFFDDHIIIITFFSIIIIVVAVCLFVFICMCVGGTTSYPNKHFQTVTNGPRHHRIAPSIEDGAFRRNDITHIFLACFFCTGKIIFCKIACGYQARLKTTFTTNVSTHD